MAQGISIPKLALPLFAEANNWTWSVPRLCVATFSCGTTEDTHTIPQSEFIQSQCCLVKQQLIRTSQTVNMCTIFIRKVLSGCVWFKTFQFVWECKRDPRNGYSAVSACSTWLFWPQSFTWQVNSYCRVHWILTAVYLIRHVLGNKTNQREISLCQSSI